MEPDAPPLVTELAYGACRRFYSIRAEVDACLKRALRKGDQDVYALLMIGAYQIRHTDVPIHAAVSETVAAATALRKPWARPLVNAVLRRIARTDPSRFHASRPPATRDMPSLPYASAVGGTSPAEDSFPARGSPSRSRAEGSSDEARHDHPQWLIDALQAAHPDACPELFEVNNSRAPMALRINRARIDPRRYRSELDSAGLAHRPGIAPESVILERPVPARKLPGFDRGWVAVQDDGAQLAAGLLDPPPRAAVLDACAAPGGKTFHLLEREPSLKVTALDLGEHRLAYMKRDARRLGHSVRRVIAGDATGNAWWEGEPFDAILLDVPCSGTGTLRRHPDIKVNRRPDTLATTTRQQRALLAGVWPTLSCGGTLLYCTCSVLPAENQDVVAGFIRRTPGAKARAIAAEWGRDAGPGRLLLPRRGGADGFFFALIDKVGNA